METAQTDKQHITLHLDTHVVNLNVPRQRESLYRQAAKQVNDSYKEYLRLMPKAPSSEYLWAYTALRMACSWLDDARGKELQPVRERLQELDQLVRNQLNETEN